MAARKPPLTQGRREYAIKRTAGKFVGKPLHYNAAPASRYASYLRQMVEQMVREYERELSAVQRAHGTTDAALDASLASQFRIALNKLREKFSRMFRQRSRSIVDNIFGQIDKASAASLASSLKELSGGLTIETSIMPPALAEVVKAKTVENVALIKTIPEEFHSKILQAVMRSIQPGNNGLQDLQAEIRRLGQVTTSRADLIAHDQTRKVTTAINTGRNKALGIKKFRWLHSGGSAEPRKLHRDKLDGQIFSYDDPPVIDERTGERGFPGQLIHCKCVAQPIVDFGDES